MSEERQTETPPADLPMAGEFLQVVTTTESKEEAERIAAAVVAQRLAACVQVVGPMTSTYWWQGKVETAEEWLCLIKSRRALYAELEQMILNLHSYDMPEIIALPVDVGSRDYMAWLAANLKY